MKLVKKEKLLLCILLILMATVYSGCGKNETNKSVEEEKSAYTMTGMVSLEPVDGIAVSTNILSEKDYNTYIESVDDLLDEVSSYRDRDYSEEGDISESIDIVYDYAVKLRDKSIATTVEKYDTYMFVEFSSGIQWMFMPELEGVNAGGDKGLVSIWSVQEGKSSYIGNPAAVEADQRATDGAAEKIANAYDNYSWDVNIDDEEVTMQTGKDLSKNQIVLWDGHGGYGEQYGGSFICTKEKFTGRIPDDGKLWKTVNDHEYVITSYLIDTYVDDLSNSFLMFGICDGAKENNLIESFRQKNAAALVMFTDITTTSYAGNMMAAIVDYMLESHTLDEAMALAKADYGEHDPNLWKKYGADDYSRPVVCFGGDYKFGTELLDLLTYYLKTYENRSDFIAPENAEILIDTFDSTAYAVDGKDCFTYYRIDNGHIVYYDSVEGVTVDGIYPGMARDYVKPLLTEKGYAFAADGSVSMEGAVSYSFGEDGKVTGTPTSGGSTASTERYTKATGGDNGEYVYLSVKYTGDQVQSIEAGIMYPNAG